MSTASQPEENAPTLIDVRCPICVAAGRRALLGQVLKKDQDAALAESAATQRPALVAWNVYWCRECRVKLVFGVIAV